jgi:hypothetical protein
MTRDRLTHLLIALPLAVAVGACGSTPSPTPARPSTPATLGSTAAGATAVAASPGPVSAPSFDPADFAGPVDNPWFPLKPGTTWVYQGTQDGQNAVDTVTVEADPKIVAGVTATVVHHALALNGEVSRETDDWYAQDRQGNVWLLGVATTEGGDPNESEPGSSEGSWEAGVGAARPGIVMPATPAIGDSQLQALVPGTVEDHSVVLLTDTRVLVPAGTYSGVLLTAEWSPLQPDVLRETSFGKGIGEIREADVAGGDDVLELVKVTTP